MVLIKNDLVGLVSAVLIDSLWQQEECSHEGQAQNTAENVKSTFVVSKLEDRCTDDGSHKESKTNSSLAVADVDFS